ncbi:hypothetical protein ACFL13_01305 [Patescibacteria group bacterium]
MEDKPQPATKPIKIIVENVPSVDVARYYLEVEFSNIFKDPTTNEVSEAIVKTIQELPTNKIWALLEAISFTFRLNGVFYIIGRDSYTWNEEIWHVKDLILTGMDSRANKVIFSDKVNGDSLKFKNYLLNYFEKADDSDPEGLLSYKPSGKKMVFEKLLMKEQDGKIHILDGSHRLTEMLLADKEEVVAYVGHPNTREAEKHPIARVGSSIFILLTILFKKGNTGERKAVLTVLKQLVNNSVDGSENAIKYWIDRQRDSEIKEAGESILK